METAEHQNKERLPASVRKLKEQYSDSSEDCTSKEETVSGGPEGFHFIDISVLTSVFETLWCPSCKQGHAVLEEDEKAKMGLASLLILKCSSSKCKFVKLFYTSNKVVNSQAFEVNRRVVDKKYRSWSSRPCQVLQCDEHVTTNAGKFISRPSQGSEECSSNCC